MSDNMTAHEVDGNTPSVAKPAGNLSFKPENFAADMAKLAAEMGVKIEGKEEPKQENTVLPETPIDPPTPPAQPDIQAAVTNEATKSVEVPDKFKNPDGTVNVAQIEKSTANAEEALAKYLEKEKELKRKINEVKAKENAYINPPATIAPPPDIHVNTTFAEQLEADLAKDGAGVVLVKLFTAAQEAAEEKVRGEISGLKTIVSENATTQQVKSIGKKDPWVFTTEGIETLTKILDEQPYMQKAVDPYKAAYLHHKGMQSVVSQSSPQVLTPNPVARPSAPVPTGQAASQTQTNPESMFDKLNSDQKLEFIKRLPSSEQEKWYVKAGFPAFNVK